MKTFFTDISAFKIYIVIEIAAKMTFILHKPSSFLVILVFLMVCCKVFWIEKIGGTIFMVREKQTLIKHIFTSERINTLLVIIW